MGATHVRRPIAVGLVSALLVTLVGWSPPARPQTADAASPTPVAEWKFDEGTGTTATDSVGSLVGTLSGGTSWLGTGSAQGGGAVHFDGVDDAITVPSSPTLEPAGSFTIMFWVRSPDVIASTNQTIVQKNFYGCDVGSSWSAGQSWQAVDARVLRTGYASSSGLGTDTRIPPWNGGWHEIALVVDPGSMYGEVSAWIDGFKLVQPLGAPFTVRYDATGRIDDHLTLGGPGAACPSLKAFHGDVDDLRLYDSALTDDQVLAMMPVFPTTSSVLVSQDGSADLSSITTDRDALFESIITPAPAIGDGSFYLAKDGGPEALFATRDIVAAGFGALYVSVPAGSLEPGSYTIRAQWNGGPNWLTSSSAAKAFTVHRRTVAMTLAASPSGDLPGGGSTLTAALQVVDPPSSSAITGSIEFHDVTGGGDVLIGTTPLSYVGSPSWNRATIHVGGLTTGTHTYQARYAGSDALAGGTAQTTVTIGRQPSSLSMTLAPNPVLNTGHATATVSLGTGRKDGVAVPPLPAPTGTLRLKRVSDGAIIGSATVSHTGGYTFTLPVMATGSVVLVADYLGDVNFVPSTSGPVTLVIKSDIVDATGITTSYSTFYPVIDGYRDTVQIKGVRNEPIAVAIRVYSSSNVLVKSATVASGTGAYAVSWNGRTSSGAVRASGTYRVVQTLTDSHGVRRVVTTSVSLSKKKLHYYTKTLSKLGSKLASVGHILGGQVLKYANGSIRIDSNGAWAAAGWQFTLPSATVYKSITMGVYGNATSPLNKMMAQSFTVCSYSPIWVLACFGQYQAIHSTKSWTTRSISPAYNRNGTTVRVAVSSLSGWAKIYKVRLVVRYGILR